MSTATVILIVVVVVVVILLLALYFASRRRAAQRSEEQRERSREEFGSEYERAAEEKGSEEEAERSLAVMHPDVADDYRGAAHQGRSRGAFGRVLGRRSGRGVHRRPATGHPTVPRRLRAARAAIERLVVGSWRSHYTFRPIFPVIQTRIGPVFDVYVTIRGRYR